MATKSLKELTDLAMLQDGVGQMRPVIEKELLHYEILRILRKHGYLETLTFQGGTSLRLCYGATRYSEDLDFTGGEEFTPATVNEMARDITEDLKSRFGLEVSVKEPKVVAHYGEQDSLKVDVWQISINTNPDAQHEKRQRIKLEIINIPSLTKEERPLVKNYDHLPDISVEMYPVQTLDEIFCDKLVALANCTAYVRHRDIWDITWMYNTQNMRYKADHNRLIEKKLAHYSVENFEEKCEALLGRLPAIVAGKEFRQQMTRFLPARVLTATIDNPGFQKYLVQVNTECYQKMIRSLYAPTDEPEFKM